MKAETLIWTIVLLIGVVLVAIRSTMTEQGMGKAYVKATPKEFVGIEVPPKMDAPAGTEPGKSWVAVGSPEAESIDISVPGVERIGWTRYEGALQREFAETQAADPNQNTYQFSLPRSMGIWIAAFFTLAIFSFAYKDNPLYRLAEAILVGVSAAYWMVVGFWDVIVPNLIARLAPAMTMRWALPGLEGRDTEPNYWYIAPLVLGAMLLWRLAPKGGWIARWPLAFVLGTFCGLRLIGFLHADFLTQIRATMLPLYVESQKRLADGSFAVDAAAQPLTGFDFWDSLQNVIIVVGVLACLVYFFFSFEHKGVVGMTARLGIWFLMITFGAAFGYTVMGRIALFSLRLEFLFDDWLWFIDPMGRRAVESAAAVGSLLGLPLAWWP